VDGSQLTALNASNLTSGTVPAARFPAMSGDISSTAGSTVLKVAALQGNALNAASPATGTYLKFDGSSWSGAGITLTDLKSHVSGPLFPAPGCTPSQTLTWVSVSDQFACSAIAISDSAIAYRNEPANTVFAAPVGAAGAPAFRTLNRG